MFDLVVGMLLWCVIGFDLLWNSVVLILVCLLDVLLLMMTTGASVMATAASMVTTAASMVATTAAVTATAADIMSRTDSVLLLQLWLFSMIAWNWVANWSSVLQKALQAVGSKDIIQLLVVEIGVFRFIMNTTHRIFAVVVEVVIVVIVVDVQMAWIWWIVAIAWIAWIMWSWGWGRRYCWLVA